MTPSEGPARPSTTSRQATQRRAPLPSPLSPFCCSDARVQLATRHRQSTPCAPLPCLGVQGSYRVSFGAGRKPDEALHSGGERRRLLEEAGGEPEAKWRGYSIQRRQQVTPKTEGSAGAPGRFIGNAKNGANRLYGGLLMNLQRKGINITDLCGRDKVGRRHESQPHSDKQQATGEGKGLTCARVSQQH